jgi:predicted nucleotidyltransferase
MATTARHLAARLGADERTLRRAVAQGTVRGSRPSPRRLAVSDAEERYLHSHWSLLQRLRALLRTEPNVRMAAVFGSVARGDDGPGSDIDVLVDLRDATWERRQRLNTRLERALQRPVELVLVERLARDNPGLLADALRDGRILADRGEHWPALKRREPAIRRAGREHSRRQASEARALVEELIGR